MASGYSVRSSCSRTHDMKESQAKVEGVLLMFSGTLRVISSVAVLTFTLGEGTWSAPGPMAHPVSSQETTLANPKAEAYYFFLLGRHLENTGDVTGAANAYDKAAQQDPESATIFSELGAMYVRHNQPDKAIAAAKQALIRDNDSEEAHRILGMVYAALGDNRNLRMELPRNPQVLAEYTRNSISHLEQARALGSSDIRVLFTLGRLYLSTRAHENAIEVLTDVLDKEPHSNQALPLLARAYDGVGQRLDAIALLETATGTWSRSSKVLRELAKFYEQELRWADAVRTYEKAIQVNARSVSLKSNLASALLNAGETSRARDVLREVVELKPRNAPGLYLLSEVELRLNNFQAAKEMAQRLIALEPGGIRGAFALAQVFERCREYYEVIKTLEPAVAAARDGNMGSREIGGLLVQIGSAYQQLGEFDQAIVAFEEALKLSPNEVAFEAQLVQGYVTANRFLDALKLVRQARQYRLKNLSLLRLEALALEGLGEFEDAVSVMKLAVDTHKDSPVAYVALSNLYGQAGDLAQAQDILETAEKKFPGNTLVLFQRGTVFERQRQYEKAELVFREILSQDPKHAAALNYLGYMLADQDKKLEESVDLLQRAIKIDPYNGSFLDSLGWAYFKLNRFDLAEPHLLEASEQLRTNSVVQDHLGDLMYSLGRYREAIAAWERALSGDGNEIEVITIQKKIRNSTTHVDRD